MRSPEVIEAQASEAPTFAENPDQGSLTTTISYNQGDWVIVEALGKSKDQWPTGRITCLWFDYDNKCYAVTVYAKPDYHQEYPLEKIHLVKRSKPTDGFTKEEMMMAARNYQYGPNLENLRIYYGSAGRANRLKHKTTRILGARFGKKEKSR